MVKRASMNHGTYHDLLREEFDRRRQVNSAYSLRAFARDLGISAPRLSQVLSRKQGLSIEAARALSKKLRISESERDWFCDSVGALHARSRSQRSRHEEKFQQYRQLAQAYSELQLEYFKVISDWYHFAILELTHLSDFKSDPDWIAERLGISPLEASEAIARMKGLELLGEENGRLVDRFRSLQTENDVPSSALKKFHSQLIQKALSAMYEQDVQEREISSSILSIRRDRLPEFKQKIRKFMREFNSEPEESQGKDAVFCLSLQFHEITRRA
jgi:uncharacterized protein (TIGR02147 family)